MTYDIALWKAKVKTPDTVGLIAITLSEGCECKAVSRFPKAKVLDRLPEIFGCSIDALPFEADITGQGALFGLPHSTVSEQLEAFSRLAQELGLYLYDFQKNCPSESDVEAFQRRGREHARSEAEETFLFAHEAASKGSLYDMHLVGSCYRYGTGVAKDLSKAIDWYEKAAQSGMPKALVSLADMYRGELGDEPSLRNGLGCLQRAVVAGNPVALAMLAEWTRDGIGMPPDAASAVALWQKLLEVDACVAAFELAKAYEHGEGVDQSTDLAIDYYRKSREAGHPEALRNLRRLGAGE